MNPEILIELLKNKNVITKNNKLKSCWKKNFDNECELYFNEFQSKYRSAKEAWFCLLNNIEPYHCEVCGDLAKFTGNKKSKHPGYNTVCDKCSPNKSPIKLSSYKKSINNRTEENREKIFNKRKQTCLEKYGDENYALFGSSMIKNILKEKYGNENFNNRTKYKETCLKKYGVECNLQLLNHKDISLNVWKNKDIIREKQKHNSIKKYGYDSPNKCPEIIEKQKEGLIKHYGSLEEAYKQKHKNSEKTKLKKYGDSKYHNKEKMSKTLLERHLKFEKDNNCTRYGVLLKEFGQGWENLNLPIIYDGRFRYISNEYLSIIKKYSEEKHNLQASSKQETELYNFIKNCTKNRIYRNVKNIIKDNNQKYELDIFIPKLNIAFEYNGSYWHSDLYKDKYYHQIKTKLCYENGIMLVHIYDFDWINKKDEIKKHIKELFEGNDCSKYNWISVSDYNNYKLTEPNLIQINNGDRMFNVYDEGNFIKK